MFIAGLIIFLNIYYSVINRKYVAENKIIDSRAVDSISVQATVDQTTAKKVLNLVPVPQKVIMREGIFNMHRTLSIKLADSLKNDVNEYLKEIPDINFRFSESAGNIEMQFLADVPAQGYNIDILPEKIKINYSSKEGLYYSLISLKVLNVNYKGLIPCFSAVDYPDLPVRGLMLDISRDKVPTPATLRQLASLLSDLKYNHLELYVEGFSFAYPSFKNLWEGKETPITGDEIKELDAFCKAHFIDLTANQNSLGHMAAWLATDQYKDLAECPKGYKLMGIIDMKATLDPTDPRSIELISTMTDDLLPNFTSNNFNVNLDEPFELGLGKSKKLADQIGKGQIFFDYMMKIRDISAKHNKSMMMWGDNLLRFPELMNKIPKDITVLDWGYEASYPYSDHCKALSEGGVQFMVCPGTNSWTSLTGRTDNMLSTVESAVTNAVKYGGKGMIITDWGDMGHWQYLPVSYPGYVAGGALSWNSGSRQSMPLADFLSSYVYRDNTNTMGDLVLNLGRYNRYEEFLLFNMTTTALSLQFGLRDRLLTDAIFNKFIGGIGSLMGSIAPTMVEELQNNYNNRHAFNYDGLDKFLNSSERKLEVIKIGTPDSLLIRDEYINAIRLVKVGAGLQYYMKNCSGMTVDEQLKYLSGIKDNVSNYLDENRKLWLARNKPGGLDRSTKVLWELNNQIKEKIEILSKPLIPRKINRFLERTGTAGAVLYIRHS